MRGMDSTVPGVPVLQARELVKRFGRKLVLDGVNLDVRPGEVVALVGENGSGKTTLLRMLGGLLRPDAGWTDARTEIGYCPQIPGLIELLNAEEHLRYFGAARNLPGDVAVSQGRRLLSELRFPIDDTTSVRYLSSGSRQKLNLALAALGDPGILLFDEPYQGFDHGSYVSFWDRIRAWQDQGRAIIVVTHLLVERQRADRVLELAVHRGSTTVPPVASGVS